NSAVGAAALRNNTTASDNTAIGSTAMRENTTGESNTAIGSAALMENKNGGEKRPWVLVRSWKTSPAAITRQTERSRLISTRSASLTRLRDAVHSSTTPTVASTQPLVGARSRPIQKATTTPLAALSPSKSILRAWKTPRSEQKLSQVT